MSHLLLPSKGGMTPLWIIALFVSLTETVTGIAVTQASGQVQLYLTYFVTLFPVGVATAFFLILAFRWWTFYGPAEYPTYIDPREFRGESIRPLDEESMNKLLTSKISEVISDKALISRVVESIQKGNLIVDPSPLLGSEEKPWVFPYEQFRSIQELLDTIWAALPRNLARPYSYGREWAFQVGSKVVNDIGSGSTFARKHHPPNDTRSLAEIGITPGMRLLVVSPK